MTGLMMRVEALFLFLREEEQSWSRETVNDNYGRLFVMEKTDWLRKCLYGAMWKKEKSACLFLVVRCVFVRILFGLVCLVDLLFILVTPFELQPQIFAAGSLGSAWNRFCSGKLVMLVEPLSL